MSVFEFQTAGKIIFGNGKIKELSSNLEGGYSVLLVRGKQSSSVEVLKSSLNNGKRQFHEYIIDGEPDINTVRNGVAIAKEFRCDMVIGIGGGSVIDTAKAIAGLANNPGDIFDYLEVVGKGYPLTNPALFLVAIPTTAGTGSEVTKNAVMTVPDGKIKVSLRSPRLFPRIALVDPQLTYGMPKHISASTGMDALTQVIEPFVSNKAIPITDMFCREGIRRAARSIRRVVLEGDVPEAREDMAFASLMGGLSLANAGLGAVHGFAAPIGGEFHAPHGAICARLLPEATAINVNALREWSAENPALERYAEIAKLLTGNENATIDDGVEWLRETCTLLDIPGLSTYGIRESDIPGLVAKSKNASSMKGNPIPLTDDELATILRLAL